MMKTASRKVISLVASFTLAFSLLGAPAVGFAAEPDNSADMLRSLQAEASNGAATTTASYVHYDEANVAAAASGTGSVEVRAAMLIAHESAIGSMKATLLQGATPATQTEVGSAGFTAKAQTALSETGSVAAIEDVPAGDYILRVEGADFVPFSQQVTVSDGDRTVVNLVDRFSELTCADATTGAEVSVDEYAGRGLMPYGDFNGDGAIGAADGRAMLSAIASIRAREGGQPTAEEQQRFGLGLLREAAADEGTPDEGESEAGETEQLQAYESVPVGLNAFQKLASLAGSQAKAGTARAIKETKGMTADAGESVSVSTTGSSSVEEALFSDNGESVQLKHADDATEISDENPVELTIDANGTSMGAITIAVPGDSPNAPTAGQVIVETEDNVELVYNFAAANTQGRISSMIDMRANLYAAADGERVTYADSGVRNAEVNKTGDTITIDLSSNGVAQVPVKLITIKVTATSSNKLAEIAKVEFLNGMSDKIPEPDLDIPTKLSATPASKSISLTWEAQRNITGYEVEVSYNGASTVTATVVNSATISSIGGKELVNYRTYTLRVRSTNGEWRSPWSAAIECTPKATSKPMAPAAPRVTGNYNSLSVSWAQALDAETHSVYYKKASDSEYKLFLKETDQLSCTIPDLELSTYYNVVITGTNEFGEGPRSPEAGAETTPDKVKVPWYKLINRTAQGVDQGTPIDPKTVIKSVTGDNGSSVSNDPWWAVDGDYNTYYTGRSGGYTHGVTVEFNKAYDMDTIVLTSYLGQPMNSYSMAIQAWDGNGTEIKPGGQAIKFTSSWIDQKTQTLMIRTASKLEGVAKIRVAYERSVGTSWSASTIAELAFYDTTLYSDVMGLWADEEHTVLNDGVTLERIQALRTEVDTVDPQSNEYHPSQSLLIAELTNAEIVCRNGNLREPVKIDPALNTNGKVAKTGVGGLNGWQPLGVAAKGEDEIAIYVGKKGETEGAVPLAFYIVQNHPDISTGFAHRLTTADSSAVKVGLNTFRIPRTLSSIDMEQGGSLYAVYETAYTNANQYVVRVSGGSYIPVLDIHNVTDENQRMQLINKYVQELKTYDPEEEHATYNHTTPGGKSDYDEENCIANATDIVLADVMYSVPVSQVAKALGITSSSTAEQLKASAEKLSTSLKAGDEMMKLFYQHKGFVKDNTAGSTYGANNAWPTLRQNIRYVRVSGNVFMYAAGNHVGIQWGSEGNLVNCSGVTLDDKGKWLNGVYFGWGIAHELGHEINQGCYTYAETTNNYYSQLTQATDNLATPRLRWNTYDTVYNRVTSGAKGASSGKTGIAMYWQLHLAYDDGYNYQTYGTAKEMFENLVFARIDAYARNVGAAPVASNELAHALTLSKFDAGANSKDNSLMRLACAATQKNLLAFFEAWGLTPDSETIAYAQQWPKEERAIQYQTDSLRLYRIGDLSQLKEAQYGGLTSVQSSGEALKAKVTASLDYPTIADRPNTTESQQITVKLTGASTNKEILGYEIRRNGEPIGFLRANDFDGGTSAFDASGNATFVDTINTVNNRVFSYSVVPVGKLLGYGNEFQAGQVKVSHHNSISKDKWTATTNMTSGTVAPNEHQMTETTIDGSTVIGDTESETSDTAASDDHPVKSAIDGDKATSFSGTVSGADARVTIDFNEQNTVVGMQYIPAANQTPISAYEVQTSTTGADGDWKTVASGTFAFDGDGAATVYFERGDDQYLYGHEAGYLRLIAKGQTSAAIGEISVFGPEGDDAEFLANGIGILDKNEKLGLSDATQEPITMPAGSLVFVGTYTGNPAYNALLLFDQDGNIVGGTAADGTLNAKEVVFAPPVAADAKLGDVKTGFWVYYIEPQYVTNDMLSKLKSVKAELYRVDNALTLEGQRLVADTLSVTMPTDLSKIDLSFGQVSTASVDLQQDGRTASGAEQNAEGAVSSAEPQVAGTPIDNASVVDDAPAANASQSDAMGAPIYDTASASAQSDAMGSPIYGQGDSGVSGTPIYDNATPLAAPHKDTLAIAAMRLLGGSLAEALQNVNADQASSVA